MDVGVAAILLSLVLATGCAERPTVQVDEPWVDRAAALYYVAPDDDCGSADPNVGPEMPELCNGIDDNCDGAVDEGVTSTFFRDGDGDTYGTGGEWVASCEAPAGFAANGADCNDGDAAVSPDAEEVCDHQDNDCDREVDEEVTTLFYADVDGDTFGDAANGALACTATAGRVADSTDCDDTRATVWPAAPELCDALDNDCDGAPGRDEVDADSDTELTCGGDCDDAEPLAWSGAIEETGDGVDNDCNGVVDADAPTCDSLVRHSSESVQAAIDAATEGDVICVAGGTYVESLDFGGAGVTVWGVHGPDTTFLDGGGVGRVVRFASAEGAGAVLTGFTVQNGAIDAGNGAGIEIVDASPTLNDLVVTANTASTVWDQRGAGISVELTIDHFLRPPA